MNAWVQEIYEKLLKHNARRDRLFRGAPICPSCQHEQVQLMSDKAPAQWRCRICKHKFEFDPI